MDTSLSAAMEEFDDSIHSRLIKVLIYATSKSHLQFRIELRCSSSAEAHLRVGRIVEMSIVVAVRDVCCPLAHVYDLWVEWTFPDE